MTIPPIPPGVDAWTVSKPDGTETLAVEVSSAASLVGLRSRILEQWITEGKVEIVLSRWQRLVCVDSLWAALPETMKI